MTHLGPNTAPSVQGMLNKLIASPQAREGRPKEGEDVDDVAHPDAENFTSLAKSPNEDESAINARVVA